MRQQGTLDAVRGWFASRTKNTRPISALQVEVTSRCARACAVCPRTAVARRWQDGDLDMGLWDRLAPHLHLVDHVHLQGWGEPLLHRNLPDMVADARKAGCSVGITTNGDLLDRAAFDAHGVAPSVVQALESARNKAHKMGFPIWTPATSTREMLTCALNPLRMAFVSRDGRVGPCVNLLLPVQGSIPRATHQGSLHVEPELWGHLADDPLPRILDAGARQRFVEPLARRLEAERRFLAENVGEPGVLALERLEEAHRQREQNLERHLFPAPCTGCHLKHGW